MATKYKRRLLNPAAQFPAGDGPGLNSIDGKLILSGGWDGNRSPSTTNEMWQSIDGGFNFTSLGNALWQGKHSFASGVKDGLLWFLGGDAYNSNKREVWTWNPADNTHNQITTDWGNGLGDRILFGYCVHGDYHYIALGQLDLSEPLTFANSIYRSTDGETWEFVCNVPAYLENRCTPVFESLGGKMYIGFGAQYNATTGHTVFFGDLYEMGDGLNPTFTQVIANDEKVKSIYADAAVFDGKIFIIKGYHNATPASNKYGLFYWEPGMSETKQAVSLNLPSRHATGICEHNGALHIAGGNLVNSFVRNDSYKIVKL